MKKVKIIVSVFIVIAIVCGLAYFLRKQPLIEHFNTENGIDQMHVTCYAASTYNKDYDLSSEDVAAVLERLEDIDVRRVIAAPSVYKNSYAHDSNGNLIEPHIFVWRDAANNIVQCQFMGIDYVLVNGTCYKILTPDTLYPLFEMISNLEPTRTYS